MFNKNTIIFFLTCMCICLFITNIYTKNELDTVNANMNSFKMRVVNWENGEKLLFIDGIQDYIIGFAIDNNNQLFWHHVTRLYDAGPSNSIAALGVCKNGKYAARPAGCFNKNEYFEKQPFLTETCNLFK